MTLLLIRTGLVKKCFLLGGGGVGAYSKVGVINFLGFQGRHLFEVGG